MRHVITAITLLLGATAAQGAGVSARPSFAAAIPNIPGKSLKVVEVSFAPGAVDGSHRHASSAYIYAQVLEGAIRSQVEGEPARIFRVGEHWDEKPGAHHIGAANASKTRPARLLAVFVVDTDDTILTTPDKK
ncbi:cupin domain-containing protein [Sphingomonas quercus]|uniref:Cupin domain-containing protein n=1 Tax=Sphingomonas quercus TaxID=2842451 RepID=A0ABS6BIH4_9SPHN|nr:cupin domain-containing protein [Sphingomonas quercus]MBU3078106.1 cupin domain-containing protein [Sphingomonas quercus]